MRLLAFILLFYHVLAKDISKVEKVDVCPDIGYYFKRESNPNGVEQSCQLCFCKNNGTAVCWLRDNKRCDKEHYYHFAKKRLRRSPSFSDIFFRDAARDVLNKQLPADQCKPYESSYSEGCPPADWCIGCTICDCDANGRWDCHTLSFCPDDKGKKQVKKKRFGPKTKVTKRQLPTKITTTNTMKKTTKKQGKYVKKYQNQKQSSKQMKINQKQVNMKNKKARESQKKKVTAKKAKPLQKKTTPARRQANSTKKNTQQDRTVNKATKLSSTVTKTDATAIFAESILKKVMASVEKFLNENQQNINKSNAKALQKRSMSKQVNTNTKKNKTVQTNMAKSKTGKVDKKHWMKKVLVNKKNEKLGINRRKRESFVTEYFKNNIGADNNSIKSTLREVTGSDRQVQSQFTLENKNNLNNLNYFSYFIDGQNYNADNLTTTELPTSFSIEKLYTNTQKISSSTIKMDTENVTAINKDTINDTKLRENTEVNVEVSPVIQNFTSTDLYKNISCGRICELRKSLKSFFFKHPKNSTKLQYKNKKTGILRKLKTFFNKIFHITRPKTKKLDNARCPFRKRSVLRSMCKDITSCSYNFTDELLRSKLNQLKVESNKIIKSVKIIEGLLKLLSSNTIEDKFKNHTERTLVAILNDEYEASLVNLTGTQRIQIYYIKENTNIFVQSIENFANILKDLVDYLTISENVKKMKLPRRYHRFVTKSNQRNREYTVSQKLDRVKKLLIRYNLVQNKFMKQMYDAISTLESTPNTTNVNKTTKVSFNTGNSDDGTAIEINMKNIINNLRKLKDLAQKLSSKNRIKRSAMGDNSAIEYLLTLMEYILKQNRPLDVPPVNDGIDLIIEAIKNAPDIKSVKKKVLDLAIETKTSETTENFNAKRRNEYKSNVSQSYAHTIRTFESLDNESPNLKDDEQNDDLIKKADITPDSKIDDDDKNKKNNTDKEVSESKHKIQKFEIFVDDDDEDAVSETTSNIKETEYYTTNGITEKAPTRTVRPLDTKLEEKRIYWVEEPYGNDNQKMLETTSEIIKATRTLNQIDKYANIHSGSDENIDKTKVKASSEEIFKRQMNLFNTLDYGTEKSILESDSREEKDNVESFPFYFA